MLLVFSPAPDRAGIDRLAHLPVADRSYGSLGTMEFETCGFPREAQKIDYPSAFPFKIGDKRLVIDLDHVMGPQLQPMRGQALHVAAAAAAICQIVGEELCAVGKKLKIAGKRDIARVAAAIDYARTREEPRDQRDQQDVVGHLVHHAQGALAETVEMQNVLIRQAPAELAQ